MRYLYYLAEGRVRPAILHGAQVFDIPELWRRVLGSGSVSPQTMEGYIELEPEERERFEGLALEFLAESGGTVSADEVANFAFSEVKLTSPLSLPNSIRDFYAFEQHVSTAHQIRGKVVPDEWYQFPVFYFTNRRSLIGPGDEVIPPKRCYALDFELEIACIIGRRGRDISESEAERYVFGYTIFNDWSARDIQVLEMRVGLGPAKGKDFASSLGPVIVSPDEIAARKTERPGVYDLQMTARLNGELISSGNWKELYHSFGSMIARASEDVELFPTDIICSGTVGTGCLLELTRAQGPWLKEGDLLELEIEEIGVLSNRVGKKEVE